MQERVKINHQMCIYNGFMSIFIMCNHPIVISGASCTDSIIQLSHAYLQIFAPYFTSWSIMLLCASFE